jgi:hypothetical protein
VDLRPSISGTWYPDDADELRRSLVELLDVVANQSSAASSKVRGLLVPHAGLSYSGDVAARAYATLRDAAYDTVVILGPYHAYHQAPFLVCQYDGYKTPLGSVPINRQLVDRIDANLVAESGMGLTPTAETTEHSIEIQLPFLQTVLGTIPVVPIMLAQQTSTTVSALVGALATALNDADPLLIASSDLSHFNPQHLAVMMDREMLRRVETLEADAVLRAEREGTAAACGAGAIATMLLVARTFGADHSEVLEYRTSGEVTGDFNSVIGYGAAACW